MRIQKFILCTLLLKTLFLPLPLLAAGADQLNLDPLPKLAKGIHYPQKAKDRSAEGWVLVEAELDDLGKVMDAKVLEAENGNLFERSALEYVLKRKVENPQSFNNGKKLYKIVFSLDGEI